ncbi:AAA family ATPase [Arthrobacter glacialis]|uniref:AAA family ATPase n=1 Tax=Arthrobacter glacialis TaxID=1664 RepID=A0A2S3ZYW6_ARTGL|nr:AAA family ATPase [Arthrobacter glacialis]POH74229.1 AAA family ATPase [Arthrobacter glacialis]
MLSATDPLPARPQRILVAGVSGSGKTSLAGRLGQLLEVPHTEIDALFHGPNWTERTDFMADVDHLSSAPGWVTEWQYRQARPLLAERADTLLWLDFPMPVSMWRLIRRTARRRLRREELWNGNFEGPLWTLFTDRDHIIRWGWQTRNKLKAAIPVLAQSQPHLQVVRLRSPREVEHWVKNLRHALAAGW